MNTDISLRDYFAIHAPEPSDEKVRFEMTKDKNANPHNDSYRPRIRQRLEILVQLRYEFADEMLKQSKDK